MEPLLLSFSLIVHWQLLDESVESLICFENESPHFYVSLFTLVYKLFVVFQVEHDTAQSMQTLLKLDSIKSRMTSAADALKVRFYHFKLC